MKRIIGLLACLLTGTTSAYAWGIMDSALTNSRYAVDKLLRQEPIYFDAAPEVSPQEEVLFISSVQQWPQKVLEIIKQSGRAEEFQDIEPLLQQGITVTKRMTAPDIILSIGNDCGDKHTAGCFLAGRPHRLSFAKLTDNANLFSTVLLHEIGHYFGLADQYWPEFSHAHPSYSSELDIHVDSIMNQAPSITCDDADGLINLIDLRLFQKRGYFSERADTGWNSLCASSNNRYQRSTTVNRNPSSLLVLTHQQSADVSFRERVYNKGQLAEERSFRFSAEPLELMYADRNAHVITDPVTHRILEISSPVRVLHTSIDRFAKEIREEEQASLKRQFRYGNKQNNAQGGYVQVQAFISLVTEQGKELPVAGELVFVIREDGSLVSPSFRSLIHKTSNYSDVPTSYNLTNQQYSYVNKKAPVRVTANVHQGIISEMMVSLTDEEHALRVYPQTGEYVLTSQHISGAVSQPDLTALSETDDTIKELASYAQKHISLLTNFYRNFYQPLFFGPSILKTTETEGAAY